MHLWTILHFSSTRFLLHFLQDVYKPGHSTTNAACAASRKTCLVALHCAAAVPKDGLQEGKACRTSSRLLLGPPTQSLNSALPAGLARCCNLAASPSSEAEAAKEGRQVLRAGAHKSAYLARAERRLTGPVSHGQALLADASCTDSLFAFESL